MPSGPTRLVNNTRERLISTDANRAQAFLAQAQQAAWRAAYNDIRSNWRLYPGLTTQAQTLAAPLYGEVYAGLFVRPDAPAYLTVDPGVAMMIDTSSAGADDSAYAYVSDPGVQVPGVLNFTPNGTGATLRWDVVECQPVDTLLESSSRDVYNPGTGLFTPGVVDKVRANRLTYRIRLGTPGVGFPGAAPGWLPLAVCAVRNGATGFNQCDFYDVRPLVSERVLPQPVDSNAGFALPREVSYSTFEGQYSGYSEAEFGGYLAGGKLQTSAPATSLAKFGDSTFDDGGDWPILTLTNANNIGGVYALADKIPVYAAALFPQPPVGQGFIPRWARYSEASVAAFGRRVPNGPRGIVVITTAPPSANGLYLPLAFPTGAQLGVMGVGVPLGIASSFPGPVMGYSVQAGRRYEHSRLDGLAWAFAASSLSSSLAVWDLTPGVHFPAHARSIRCSFSLVVTAASSFSFFQARSVSVGFPFSSIPIPSGLTAAPTSVTCAESMVTLSRPVVAGYATSPFSSWSIRLVPSIAGVTFNSANLYVHGWEF